MNLILGVVAFVAAFLAEYYHDRWSIEYNQLTTANIPPWTREEFMRKKVARALWKTLYLSALQSFDLIGVIQWKLPVWAICAGGAAGSLLAVRVTMWEDWREARSRMYDATGKRKPRTKDQDDQQTVEDPDQIGLL